MPNACPSEGNEHRRARNPLSFACWRVHPEIVAENLREFEARHAERVELRVVDEPYEPRIREVLTSDRPLDLFYAQRGEASRWYSMGLIRPIDDLPGFDELIAQMSPEIVADSRFLDGRFLGLTYYNGGPFCLFRNERVLTMAGLSPGARVEDYPSTWEEVRRQALEMKRRRIVDCPILLSWHDAHNGLPWNLLAQCHAEGERFVDANLHACFGSGTPIEKVLADWRQWWAEALVPRESLTWQDHDIRRAWMRGGHAFHPTLDYHIASYNDMRACGGTPFTNLNPCMPGATGQPTLTGHPFLCMSSRRRSETDLLRVWDLARFLGGTDRPGEFHVHRKWVCRTNFEVPYPAIYTDPKCQSAILEWMYPPLAEMSRGWMFSLRDVAQATPVMRVPWYLDWSVALHEMVKEELLLKGTRTPAEVSSAMRQLWEDLRSDYFRRNAPPDHGRAQGTA